MREIGAKTHLSKLLTYVTNGESITITGIPVAIIIPARSNVLDAKTAVNNLRQWRNNITWGTDMTSSKAKLMGRK